MKPPEKKQKRLTHYFDGLSANARTTSKETKRKRARLSHFVASSNHIDRSRNGRSSFGVCPICRSSIALHKLISHASSCNAKDNDVQTETLTTNSNTLHSNGKKRRDRTMTKISGDPWKSEEMKVEQEVEEPLPESASSMKPKPKDLSANLVTPLNLAPVFQAQMGTKGNQPISKFIQIKGGKLPWCEPIPGLFVFEDFLSKEEELNLLSDCVDTGGDVVPIWKFGRFNGKHLGKRWGVHCNLRDRRVGAPENPLPKSLQEIVVPKLGKVISMLSASGKVKNSLEGFSPNEANAIDYRKNQGHWLEAHVDDRKLSKEPIANLSLVGDCYMTFRNVSRHRNCLVVEQRVFLKRRCLQILTGKSRYDFSHAIANIDLLTERRVSITLRESPLTMVNP